MSKVSDQFHKVYSEHHTEKARIHLAHATVHTSAMEHHDEGPEHEYHKKKHELHKATAETHATLAAYHAKMMKASADELGKADGAVPASLENAIRKVFLEMFGNSIVPSNVSSVYKPGVAVPRHGSPDLPTKPNVPEIFEKLVAVEDGSSAE
jgi:hypothetical protein